MGQFLSQILLVVSRLNICEDRETIGMISRSEPVRAIYYQANRNTSVLILTGKMVTKTAVPC